LSCYAGSHAQIGRVVHGKILNAKSGYIEIIRLEKELSMNVANYFPKRKMTISLHKFIVDPRENIEKQETDNCPFNHSCNDA